jgi:hypothetical protein
MCAAKTSSHAAKVALHAAKTISHAAKAACTTAEAISHAAKAALHTAKTSSHAAKVACTTAEAISPVANFTSRTAETPRTMRVRLSQWLTPSPDHEKGLIQYQRHIPAVQSRNPQAANARCNYLVKGLAESASLRGCRLVSYQPLSKRRQLMPLSRKCQ